jgi:hypothetical protein
VLLPKRVIVVLSSFLSFRLIMQYHMCCYVCTVKAVRNICITEIINSSLRKFLENIIVFQQDRRFNLLF